MGRPWDLYTHIVAQNHALLQRLHELYKLLAALMTDVGPPTDNWSPIRGRNDGRLGAGYE